MKIDKNISEYSVSSRDPIKVALGKISGNKRGTVFVLSVDGRLEGVLTDGDFRRWLLSSSEINLDLPVTAAMNLNYLAFKQDTNINRFESSFTDGIRIIPIVDDTNHLLSVALPSLSKLMIGEIEVSSQSPSFIIAEIGNNHQGDLSTAINLIDLAVESGATCAKFQMRHISSMYRNYGSNIEGEDLGAEYTLDLLSKFQLSNIDLFKAFDYCKGRGIIPLCTPWDLESFLALKNYGMDAYKVASADLTNAPLIEAIASAGKPIICSTGMSNEQDIKSAIKLLRGLSVDFALLHCNSTYPAPFRDINLGYLSHLKEISGGGLIGYSGHERGYAIPIAAVALGAKIIEKHLTLDKKLEGNDHRVSLLPQEFTCMVQGIREVEESMGSILMRKSSQGELMNREVLGKSIVAKNKIHKGDAIQDENIEIKAPGRGLPPNMREKLIGLIAKKDYFPGDFFYSTDLDINQENPRIYSFNRPFGIPVRFHDFQLLKNKSNFNLFEIHFSYRDLTLEPKKYLDEDGYDADFVVHAPELFSGDHVLNLASSDDVYRTKSINELQRVIDLTISLKKYFTKSSKPLVVVNIGGYSAEHFISPEERRLGYLIFRESLAALNAEGVEIIPQTMPPYPWHFGGQQFHNLFLHPDEIEQFCKMENMRICLDISHSKLASNFIGQEFTDFLKIVGPYVAHMHIADAAGVDGEGLQIDDGEIEFKKIFNVLNELCPQASFIPEIWQGHKNEGEGFWIALNKLESLWGVN